MNDTITPPQYSDEARERLRAILTKTWMLKSEIYCSDATGKRKETVSFPYQQFEVGPSEKVLDEVEAELKKREAAYGGCHNCYGKGYATVNDCWIGHDTDQDIGSRGGYVSGGSASAMKLCACERGQQLKKLMGKREVAAELKAQTKAAVSIREFLSSSGPKEHAYAIQVCDTYIEATEAELTQLQENK